MVVVLSCSPTDDGIFSSFVSFLDGSSELKKRRDCGPGRQEYCCVPCSSTGTVHRDAAALRLRIDSAIATIETPTVFGASGGLGSHSVAPASSLLLPQMLLVHFHFHFLSISIRWMRMLAMGFVSFFDIQQSQAHYPS